MEATIYQHTVLIYTKLLGFILSFSATFGFIIWVTFLHLKCSKRPKKKCKVIFRMFFCLQLVSCLENLQFIIEFFQLEHLRGLCNLQGCLIQYFSIARCLWCVLIGAWMFALVVVQIHKRNIARFEFVAYLIGWNLPFLFMVIPLITGDIENLGGYCWISKSTRSGRIVRFMAHIVPVWTCFIVLLFLITLITIYLVKLHRQTMRLLFDFDRRVQMIAKSARAYVLMTGIPMIFFMLSLFPSVNRIYESVVTSELQEHTNTSFALLFMSSASIFMHGILNTFLYVLSRFMGPCLAFALVAMKSKYDESALIVRKDSEEHLPVYYYDTSTQ